MYERSKHFDIRICCCFTEKNSKKIINLAAAAVATVKKLTRLYVISLFLSTPHLLFLYTILFYMRNQRKTLCGV